MKSKSKDVEKENGKISRPDENHFKSVGPRDLQTRYFNIDMNIDESEL